MPVYVQHQVLGKIDDVFNAEAIWQAPGLALFSRRPLLRDLLERCPREQRGRAPTRCFSHITLMLPQEEVDDDRHLTRGSRARDLADTLKTLHQKDFGDLLGADEVRYDVVGDERLQPGEVEVRFGHAVYLPAADEPVVYNVSVSRDSAVWKPVCQVYLDQRLAVLGQEGESVSHAVAGWPFGEQRQVLVINDGPDRPAEVQVRPRNALECHYDPLNGCHVVRARGANNEGARLFLKVAPTMAAVKARHQSESAAETRASVWKSRTAGSQPIMLGEPSHRAVGASAHAATDAGQRSAGSNAAPRTIAAPERGMTDATAVPLSHRPAALPADTEGTYAPVARQSATLVALALPRLSRYRDTGATSMCFGFDAALAIAAQPASALLRFSVDAADHLTASSAEGESTVTLPATFTPVDSRAITVAPVPQQMDDRYLALVTLPAPRTAAITRGARLSFGRAAPALANLRVLDAGAALQQATGVASADRLGLSRSAFSFECGDRDYQITRQSASQALYHLDEQLRFVAAIGEATPEQPYRLPAGHHLVAGHYVLRFDA